MSNVFGNKVLINNRLFVLGFILLGSLLVSMTSLDLPKPIQKSNIKVGAYYFDGWTGKTENHITKQLVDSFPDRKPIWGWITSTPKTMQAQIDYASSAGLSFFSFCWFYGPKGTSPLNQALNLYLKSPNKSKLKFCLMVANHEGFLIDSTSWQTASDRWMGLIKEPTYLQTNGKPLIIFFSLNTLIKGLGSKQAVKLALDQFRLRAQKQGLKGVSFAVCSNGDKSEISDAELCGIDILTGYNYHTAGFRSLAKVVDIDSLGRGSEQVWNKFNKSSIPYMPVVTVNWDPRPWATGNSFYSKSSIYKGYSKNSVYSSFIKAKSWVNKHPGQCTPEKLVIAYAWNEYGEGAWLTPSRKYGNTLLESLKKAIK